MVSKDIVRATVVLTRGTKRICRSIERRGRCTSGRNIDYRPHCRHTWGQRGLNHCHSGWIYWAHLHGLYSNNPAAGFSARSVWLRIAVWAFLLFEVWKTIEEFHSATLSDDRLKLLYLRHNMNSGEDANPIRPIGWLHQRQQGYAYKLTDELALVWA